MCKINTPQIRLEIICLKKYLKTKDMLKEISLTVHICKTFTLHYYSTLFTWKFIFIIHKSHFITCLMTDTLGRVSDIHASFIFDFTCLFWFWMINGAIPRVPNKTKHEIQWLILVTKIKDIRSGIIYFIFTKNDIDFINLTLFLKFFK